MTRFLVVASRMSTLRKSVLRMNSRFFAGSADISLPRYSSGASAGVDAAVQNCATTEAYVSSGVLYVVTSAGTNWTDAGLCPRTSVAGMVYVKVPAMGSPVKGSTAVAS